MNDFSFNVFSIPMDNEIFAKFIYNNIIFTIDILHIKLKFDQIN